VERVGREPAILGHTIMLQGERREVRFGVFNVAQRESGGFALVSADGERINESVEAEVEFGTKAEPKPKAKRPRRKRKKVEPKAEPEPRPEIEEGAEVASEGVSDAATE